ncbi:golgin subfamily A member 2-like [Falco cherrug]|uniref:golgin subfamily A member 2-like n=1 Tax=Falco cherrug TaxID=345164 RepID=UPI00247A3A3F|nr:golgin subfamily A member 2-like [Falco cherrug]
MDIDRDCVLRPVLGGTRSARAAASRRAGRVHAGPAGSSRRGRAAGHAGKWSFPATGPIVPSALGNKLSPVKLQVKEYQQKKSPGAAAESKENHKTKGDGRPETPLGDDQQPPENKEQSQEAVDQLEKVKCELEKEFSEEQAALREKLQVPNKTIGILASEKSELQAALAPTQQAARKKSGEAESFAARLCSSRERELELERTLASVSLQQKQAEKRNEELMKELEDPKQELYKQNVSPFAACYCRVTLLFPGEPQNITRGMHHRW